VRCAADVTDDRSSASIKIDSRENEAPSRCVINSSPSVLPVLGVPPAHRDLEFGVSEALWIVEDSWPRRRSRGVVAKLRAGRPDPEKRRCSGLKRPARDGALFDDPRSRKE